MSAAVDLLISQALISLLHYIIEENEEEEGEAEKRGGQLVKH